MEHARGGHFKSQKHAALNGFVQGQLATTASSRDVTANYQLSTFHCLHATGLFGQLSEEYGKRSLNLNEFVNNNHLIR